MAESSGLERQKPRQETQKFKVILSYSSELSTELPHILSSYAISEFKEEGKEMERAGTQENGQEMPSFDHGKATSVISQQLWLFAQDWLCWAVKMARWVKVLASNPGDLNSIAGTT